MVNSHSIDHKICTKKTQNGQVNIQVDVKSPNGKSGIRDKLSFSALPRRKE
jgi:hypothetical protein